MEIEKTVTGLRSLTRIQKWQIIPLVDQWWDGWIPGSFEPADNVTRAGFQKLFADFEASEDESASEVSQLIDVWGNSALLEMVVACPWTWSDRARVVAHRLFDDYQELNVDIHRWVAGFLRSLFVDHPSVAPTVERHIFYHRLDIEIPEFADIADDLDIDRLFFNEADWPENLPLQASDFANLVLRSRGDPVCAFFSEAMEFGSPYSLDRIAAYISKQVTQNRKMPERDEELKDYLYFNLLPALGNDVGDFQVGALFRAADLPLDYLARACLRYVSVQNLTLIGSGWFPLQTASRPDGITSAQVGELLAYAALYALADVKLSHGRDLSYKIWTATGLTLLGATKSDKTNGGSAWNCGDGLRKRQPDLAKLAECLYVFVQKVSYHGTWGLACVLLGVVLSESMFRGTAQRLGGLASSLFSLSPRFRNLFTKFEHLRLFLVGFVVGSGHQLLPDLTESRTKEISAWKPSVTRGVHLPALDIIKRSRDYEFHVRECDGYYPTHSHHELLMLGSVDRNKVISAEQRVALFVGGMWKEIQLVRVGDDADRPQVIRDRSSRLLFCWGNIAGIRND